MAFVKGPNNQVLWLPKETTSKSDKTTKEPLTGYQTHAPAGPKHCFSCKHFVKCESGCDGPKMIELSKQPHLENGDVKVHSVGLCDFYVPVKK